MSRTLSKATEAFRDTLVHRAEGLEHDRISGLYGVKRPGFIPRSSWRQALHATALGPRGMPGGTLKFLEGAFDHLAESFDVDVGPSNPQRITASSGSPFKQKHVDRWVRVDGTLYYVEGPADVSATSSGQWLTLAPVATHRWSAANFTSSKTGLTAKFLPFVIVEPTPGPDETDPAEYDINQETDKALVTIYIYGGVAGTPATYLQTDETEGIPTGADPGGHLQTDEFQFASQSIGPYPPYLSDGTIYDEVVEVLDELLAAGFRAQFLAGD